MTFGYQTLQNERGSIDGMSHGSISSAASVIGETRCNTPTHASGVLGIQNSNAIV